MNRFQFVVPVGCLATGRSILFAPAIFTGFPHGIEVVRVRQRETHRPHGRRMYCRHLPTALEDSARTLWQATPRLAAQQINMTHDTSWHKSCTCTDKDDKARLLSKGFVVSRVVVRTPCLLQGMMATVSPASVP